MSLLETISLAEIAEPLKVNIDGFNSNQFLNSQCYITSFSGVEKAINKNDSTLEFYKDNHWIRAIKIVIPENEFKSINKIVLTIGTKEFIFNKSGINIELKINKTVDKIILIFPENVKFSSSVIGRLNSLNNWPGDIILIKIATLEALSLILPLFIILFVFRNKILKFIQKIIKPSYLKLVLERLIKVIKTQYLLITAAIIIAIVFFPAGQAHKTNIANIITFAYYLYYITLNFFSLYNSKVITDIIQFILFSGVLLIGLRALFSFKEYLKSKSEENSRIFFLCFGILIFVIVASFLIHFNN
ncbi:MAG: hypothetical protein Q8L27_04005, partial [archaeon]|nr:hypothetical protein [archaeon]